MPARMCSHLASPCSSRSRARIPSSGPACSRRWRRSARHPRRQRPRRRICRRPFARLCSGCSRKSRRLGISQPLRWRRTCRLCAPGSTRRWRRAARGCRSWLPPRWRSRRRAPLRPSSTGDRSGDTGFSSRRSRRSRGWPGTRSPPSPRPLSTRPSATCRTIPTWLAPSLRRRVSPRFTRRRPAPSSK